MKEMDIEEFEERLIFLVDELEPGTVVVITQDGTPIAEFKLTAKPPPLPPPPLGEAKDLVQVPPSFFEPLPPDLLEAFEGEGQ